MNFVIFWKAIYSLFTAWDKYFWLRILVVYTTEQISIIVSLQEYSKD